MANDFDMREGTNKPINIIVTDGADPPNQIDLTGATVVWVAVSQAGTVVLTKHNTDASPTITLTTNPATPADSSKCLIAVEIIPSDAAHLIPGTYDHECRVIQGSVQEVVYPIIDDTATFGVVESYTWDEATEQPRLERSEKPVVLNARARAKLWRNDDVTANK